MAASTFTLAPADHPTDPQELEGGYKLWSTYKRSGNLIHVRSNNPNTAGGQVWHIIAFRAGLGLDAPVANPDHAIIVEPSDKAWYIERGSGFLAQGGMLLARYLMQRGERIRSEMPAYDGRVKRYRATGRAYSLPTILNGGKAVVSRDKQADERSKARNVDIATAMAVRKATNEAT